MTGGKDAWLVDDVMEGKEEGVHGRGRRGVGSITLAALVVGETKIELQSRWRFDGLNAGVLRDIFVLHQTLLCCSALAHVGTQFNEAVHDGFQRGQRCRLNCFEENISVNDCRPSAPYWTAKRVKKEYLKQKVKILTNGRVENGGSCRRVQSDGHRK